MEFSYGYEEILKRLPQRRADSHKGTYGKVLIAAGSKNMCGAAYLAGKAAYRSGAGLVYLYTEECNRMILQQLLPEAVLLTYEKENWSRKEFRQILEGKDAVAAGPGLGTDPVKAEIVREVIRANDKKRILDADALNILAAHPQFWSELSSPLVITPHLKEMERLSGRTVSEIGADLTGTAAEFSRTHGVVTVLKDARTRVSDGGEDCFVNVTGNHGMATGGSGDVLTGVIAGLAAQKMKLFEAAALGVAVHGMAGDLAAKQRGARSIMAGDIADAVLYGIS